MLSALELWCLLYVVALAIVYCWVFFKFELGLVRDKHYRRYLYDRIKYDIKEHIHSAFVTISRLLFIYGNNTVMASKNKRDLEIVYNLQWKTKGNGEANIIGVYDVPQTTLNWSTFKSYLVIFFCSKRKQSFVYFQHFVCLVEEFGYDR